MNLVKETKKTELEARIDNLTQLPLKKREDKLAAIAEMIEVEKALDVETRDAVELANQLIKWVSTKQKALKAYEADIKSKMIVILKKEKITGLSHAIRESVVVTDEAKVLQHPEADSFSKKSVVKSKLSSYVQINGAIDGTEIQETITVSLVKDKFEF